MQEAAGPQWDPITIHHTLPIAVRLFVFFLMFVCVFFLVRLVQLSWFIWRSRRFRTSSASLPPDPGTVSERIRELGVASTRAMSLQRGSWLTLLVTMTVAAEGAAQRLESVSTEKVTSAIALAGSASEVLSLFSLGIAVSAGLYAAFAAFEGKISRLRNISNRWMRTHEIGKQHDAGLM